MRSSRLVRDAIEFGAVGIGAYVVDVAVFNLLRLFMPGFLGTPVPAKTAGVIAATLVAWLGNRYWTFRRNQRSDVGQEFVEFILVAALGYAVNLGALVVSHYVLGFRSLLADNLAANVVGAALGTVLRFALYRVWVYAPGRGRGGRRHGDGGRRPSR
ncbi:MAG TPA: GtrA family protein [Microbacteriaceae bacterium]|nr:GtrA family protein [Microbacteriaceae bacterium]